MIDPQVRASIAAIAAAVANGRAPKTIYDHGQSRHVTISGQLSGDRVSLYDHDRLCHVGGSVSGTQLALYDYGRSQHISLKIESEKFTGYDSGVTAHFSGSVRGNAVTLYDSSESEWTHYSN
ncbi:MAG TPA: hypothetical protein VF856_01045 [Gemmatimonadaceae bacterium]